MPEEITRLNGEEKSPHITPSDNNSLTEEQSDKDTKDLNINNVNNFQASSVRSSTLSKDFRSPRCEAFVMTGDKMLVLNSKISPHYAKVIFKIIFLIFKTNFSCDMSNFHQQLKFMMIIQKEKIFLTIFHQCIKQRVKKVVWLLEILKISTPASFQILILQI